MSRGDTQSAPRRTCKSLWIILGAVTLTLATTLPFASPAQAQLRTASLTPGNDLLREASLPSVLTLGDLTRYRHLCAAQQAGHWQEADRDIGALRNRLL